VNVVTKATATVEAVESDNPNGQFDVILSTNALDRDGDELQADEWKQPLPDHITFDSDHGMSVATTVGSGRPFINDQGQLQVRGTFASTPHAQNVRTLVNEGHIKTTSVAFVERKGKKDARTERELLNGAFVAVPANPEAVVLGSKSSSHRLGIHEAFNLHEYLAWRRTKAADGTSDAQGGAPASPTMQDLVQAIHDAAYHLGAMCLGEGEITDVGSGADDGANKGADTTTSVTKDGSPQESPNSEPAEAATKAAAPEAPADVPAEAAELADERAAASVKARAFLVKMNLERAANAE
jgi:hypothetical protein